MCSLLDIACLAQNTFETALTVCRRVSDAQTLARFGVFRAFAGDFRGFLPYSTNHVRCRHSSDFPSNSLRYALSMNSARVAGFPMTPILRVHASMQK